MASSSPASRAWKYDVFLSFRGEDTRKNFTDHLYAALGLKGIFTFKDDEELEKGAEISSKLLTAIEESMFSIIVLSKNYASSTWCLDELAKIVDCTKEKQHTTFPIFYHVDPSDVRKQTGDFKETFEKHERDFKSDEKKVKRWRSALTHVASLSGWHLQDRHESEFMQEIVNEISRKLDVAFETNVAKDLVGIESHLEKLKPYIKPLSNNVRFIGIWGMGGIGKTTLARVVYDWLSYQYEGCCFLANVREVSHARGLVSLQEQLLSRVLMRKNLNVWDVDEGVRLIRYRLRRKKVLLVLDDVDQLEQLKALAKDLESFGSGSRIIITTRDVHLLTSHGVQYIYKVEALNHAEAIKLFRLKAFKQKQPQDEHISLSNRVVSYAQGLPLALEVLGSFLCDRSVDQWKSALDRLDKNPEKKILEVLRISYDGLQFTEKQIFLDIACFFKGKDKDLVIKILDGCEFYPKIGVPILIEKSLITISNNKFWMHDLVQVMGWEIVRGQHLDNPGKWSRLWLPNDIYCVLQENKGTHAIEGIILDQPKDKITCLSGKSFSNMNNVRLLQLSNFQLSEDLEYLSNELQFLDWRGYPSNSLPSNFHPKNLFELNMCHSNIQYLWNGIKYFEKLKIIDASHSCKLITTPDFTGVSNLEQLNLEGCKSLLTVHKSVGLLRRLIVLNLKNCENLVSFPSRAAGLKSLKILNLSGCLKLYTSPQNLGDVKDLEELDIRGTAIRQPFQTFRPTQRRNPNLKGLTLPCLTGLSFLKTLDLGDCNLLEGSIPSAIGSLSSLEELDLSRNNFITLPESIKKLLKLKILCLENCHMLQCLPELPPETTFVGAENCTSLVMETLLAALKQSTSTDIAMHFFNCSKMIKNQATVDSMEVMLLKRRLQEPSNHSSQFHICIPGVEIPEWFSDRSNWCSVSVQLPSSGLDEILGIAVCAVFAVPGYSDKAPVLIHCSLCIGSIHSYDFSYEISNFNIESDHLWLSYFSSKLFEKPVPEWRSMESYIHAGFYTNQSVGWVKKCGIRLVYKEDFGHLFVHNNVEELIQPRPACKSLFVEDRIDIPLPTALQNCRIRKFRQELPFLPKKRKISLVASEHMDEHIQFSGSFAIDEDECTLPEMDFSDFPVIDC